MDCNAINFWASHLPSVNRSSSAYPPANPFRFLPGGVGPPDLCPDGVHSRTKGTAWGCPLTAATVIKGAEVKAIHRCSPFHLPVGTDPAVESLLFKGKGKEVDQLREKVAVANVKEKRRKHYL
jgi:hypothetical protein